MSKRIKVSKTAEAKRIEIEKKKWRGNFVKNRKIGIFYIALANYVKHDSQKAGIFRRFLLPTGNNKTITTSKIGKPQIISNQCTGLHEVRSQ